MFHIEKIEKIIVTMIFMGHSTNDSILERDSFNATYGVLKSMAVWTTWQELRNTYHTGMQETLG